MSRREEWKSQIAQIEAEARAEFPHWIGKLEQLHGEFLTVAMVIDDLHDLTPYTDPIP